MFARCPCIREAFALPMPHVPYSRTSVVSLSLPLVTGLGKKRWAIRRGSRRQK